MSSLRLRGTGIATAFLIAFLLASSSIATASKYPPNTAARGFSGGLGGWTASSSFDGACAPPLLCPSATNSFQPSDGADGEGFIRSAYTGVAGATAVAGTTRGVWESPRFTYRGANGNAPTAVSFDMDRRASVDELLAVEGNSATYSVRLIDLSTGGESLTVIAPTSLAGASSWTNAPEIPIDPGQLRPGDDYKIRITSTYATGTGAVVTGNADYDNVVLSAVREPGGRGGAGGLSEKRLEELMRAATPGSAVLASKGKRLLVRVKCPRKVGRTCRITTQGMLRKRKPATARRTVKVRKGKAKLVALRVKPKARAKVVKRKRLLVRHKVRAGKVTATIFKSRKLIRRG